MHVSMERIICTLIFQFKIFVVAAAIMSLAGCNGIVSPKDDQCVQVGSVEVKWTPKDKPMVIQYYQKERCLLNCGPDAPHGRSGSRIQINRTGKTEIKIWKPGNKKPFDSVWIYVENECPDVQ